MKKIVSVILVVVLALSLGTVALAAPKEDKANGNSNKTVTTTVQGDEIYGWVEVDNFDLGDEKYAPNNNSRILLTDEDSPVEVAIVSNNKSDGTDTALSWYFEVSDAEGTYQVTLDYAYQASNLGKLEDSKVIGDGEYAVIGDSNGKDGLNHVNFIKGLIEEYIVIGYEEEVITITKANNGRAHGNNANFILEDGEFGNWKDSEDAIDDGYSHPSGDEDIATNGNVKNADKKAK